MAQPIDKGRSINQEKEPEIANETRVKKSYASPSLVEYGSIAKLTQGASGPLSDGPGMAMVCL